MTGKGAQTGNSNNIFIMLNLKMVLYLENLCIRKKLRLLTPNLLHVKIDTNNFKNSCPKKI